METIIKAALITFPFAALWSHFWMHIVKFKNRNERIVSDAKEAGRYTTAHFVKLEAGFVCIYEYEVDGRTYQWKHAITPNSTERKKDGAARSDLRTELSRYDYLLAGGTS